LIHILTWSFSLSLLIEYKATNLLVTIPTLA
jgi:hypothetical protein